jgi:hypothetical protein
MLEDILSKMRFEVVKINDSREELAEMRGILNLKDAANFAKYNGWQYYSASSLQDKLAKLKIDQDYMLEKKRIKVVIIRVDNDTPEEEIRVTRIAKPPPSPKKSKELTPEQSLAALERQRRAENPLYNYFQKGLDKKLRGQQGRTKIKLDP